MKKHIGVETMLISYVLSLRKSKQNLKILVELFRMKFEKSLFSGIKKIDCHKK